jgi:hypothetical protein
MTAEIIARLKTGAIKSVVEFGVANLPKAPYVVVKPEREMAGRGRNYRIIAHYAPGQLAYLEDYIRKDVMALLDKYGATTRNGNYQVCYATDDWSDIITNDDGTISMEQCFLVASHKGM